MKITFKKYLLLFAVLLITGAVNSQVPTYTLKATNINRPAPDSLCFEIYLLHTNPGTAVFEYPAGQYFFRFNPLVANGGTLRYRIIGTELPSGSIPQNPTVTGNELRLASNLPAAQGSAPLISSTGQGTMVARMSLRTTASSFDPSQNLNLMWRNSNDPPLFTKISAYVDNLIQEITTSETHIVDNSLVSVNQVSSNIPDEFRIFQNYPNPFNPATNIKFDVPKNSNIKLTVFDITGKELETLLNDNLSAGSYEFKWDATQYSSGIYFYRIQSQDFVETRRMLLVK